MTPLIEMRGITRFYDDVRRVGLQPIDIQIDPGECVALVGPSGSGKSTLLNVIGLIDRPTGGSYSFDGQDVSSWSRRRLRHTRSRKLGFVFQAYHLMADLNALENVELALGLAGVRRRDRRPIAASQLDRVGMSHRAMIRAGDLSGGEQQRVAVARATAHDPTVVLADEPTGNLDEVNSERVLGALRRTSASNKGLIVVTHDPRVAEWADRVVEITQ